MDSPIAKKKARKSLMGNISDFDLSQDVSTKEKSEFANSEENKIIEELSCAREGSGTAKSGSSEYYLEDTFTEETKLRLENLNQLYLSKKAATLENQTENIIRRLSASITDLRILRKNPALLTELPFEYHSSQYFKHCDLNREDVLALNLSDRVNLVRVENRLQITPCATSESLCSSIAFGSERIGRSLLASHYNSTMCIMDVEAQRELEAYQFSKEATLIGSYLKSKDCIIYCGLHNGTMKLFDVRMNSPLRYFLQSDSIKKHTKPSFNPINSIEIIDHQVLTCSSERLSLWDLRKNTEVICITDAFKQGINKAVVYRPENGLSKVICFGISELKMFDLLDGKLLSSLDTDETIRDISCDNNLKELLVLSKASPSPQNEFAKSQVDIFTIEDDGFRCLDRLEMNEDFNEMKLDTEDGTLWTIGKYLYNI